MAAPSTLRASAAVALALLAWSGAASARPPVTRVHVETFTVGLAAGEGDALSFTRVEGRLTGGMNPDEKARALAATGKDGVALIHSTSWRWERDGRIVLTYVAWAKDGQLRAGAQPLPKLAPPGPTDPQNPRPAEIPLLAPLAHGLRHLAFLLRTDSDGRVAAALGPRSVAALERIEPDVAGEIAAP